MLNLKTTFRKAEIYANYNIHESICERIEYLNYQLSHYNKIYNFNSNEEYQKYIVDNNLKKAKFFYNGYLRNRWRKPITLDEKIRKFKYYSPKYRGFINEMMQLINFVESELKVHNRVFEIVNSDFLKILELDVLLKKLNKFKSDEDAYNWLDDYYNFLSDLSSFEDVFFYDELYKKNKLEDSYPKQGIAKAPPIFAYNPFVSHLKDTMIPFVYKQKNSYELKIRINNARNKYPKDFINIDDKYPIFLFDYERIISYSDIVFITPEEKLNYFHFIIRRYDRLIGSQKELPFNAENCIKNLKKEIENYKELIIIRNLSLSSNNTLDGNTGSNSSDHSSYLEALKQIVNLIGKDYSAKTAKKQTASQAFSGLIKHYFEISERVLRVPKLDELADKVHSVSFWSKMFDNELFLLALHKRIEKKLDSKRIGIIKKDLFVKLLLDINSKVDFIYKNKTNEKGQTNKNNKDFDEHRLLDDDYLE